MTFALFITLLTVFSTVTGVFTEAVKKLLADTKFVVPSNILAFVVACVVGIGGTGAYYVLNSIEFTSVNILCMVLMGIATSLGAMVGYDKVIQTITQIKGV